VSRESFWPPSTRLLASEVDQYQLDPDRTESGGSARPFAAMEAAVTTTPSRIVFSRKAMNPVPSARQVQATDRLDFDSSKTRRSPVNLLYVPLIGFPTAVMFAVGLMFCVTVSGLPIGFACFALAGKGRRVPPSRSLAP
jgi:hypothetical protein